jgi:small subunit ribosomal protein S18
MDKDNKDFKNEFKDGPTRENRGDRGDRPAFRQDRQEFEGKDKDDAAALSKDGPAGRGARSFARKKPCPFVADKTMILDFKNMKILQRFTSDGGKIVPRYVSGVSAKNQRRLGKQIKRARNVGFIAPLSDT